MRAGTLKTIVVTQGHYANVTGLAMDAASPSFATCADDKTLRLWCLRRGSLLGPHFLCILGHGCLNRQVAPCSPLTLFDVCVQDLRNFQRQDVHALSLHMETRLWLA